MKILFLNLWHGKLRAELEQFLAEQKDIDIFCFQEADFNWAHQERLFGDDFLCVTAEEELTDGKGRYSLATFVRKPIEILEHRAVSESDATTGLGLLTKIRINGRVRLVLNVHGNAHVVQPQDTKLDAPARLHQSKDFLRAVQNTEPDIIGGDFNLLPDTESLDMFRRAGYRDLIREYKIDTTRNHLAWDRYPDRERYLYSDYCFVSPELSVQSFMVPSVEVSDHLPMIVEIKNEL